MRNTLILAVLCLGFFSCKKDYTCECTGPGTDTTANSWQVNAVTKKQAKDKCTKYENDVNSTFLGSQPKIACAIK